MKSYIKKLLNESMNNRVLMGKFIDFVVDYLSLSKNFKVRLTRDKVDIVEAQMLLEAYDAGTTDELSVMRVK